jgi:hypothetical protein
MALVTLRRNIVEATFIATASLKGTEDPEDLAWDMLLSLERAKNLFEDRFFEDRVDRALQRSKLATTLGFYLDRALRHGLLDPTLEASFADHLSRLEKVGLDFRPTLEGYIISPTARSSRTFSLGDAQFTILTPRDLREATGFEALLGEFPGRQESLPLTPQEARETIVSETSSSFEEQLEEAEPTADIVRLDSSSEETLDPLGPRTMSSIDEDIDAEPRTNIEPQASSPSIEVLLGHTVNGSAPVVWRPSVQGSPHLFVLGIPGQGKSWAIARVISELSRQGVPALVLDFHGQFTDTEGPLSVARQRTVLNAREGLPFSPFEVSDRSGDAFDWQTNAFAIAEIFGYVCKLGDMQRDVVFTSVRDSYRTLQLQREEGLETEAFPSLKQVLTRIEQQERTGRATNVAARCRPLLEMDLFRPPSGQSSDLRSLVREGLIVDLHGLADLEVLQLAAGAFLLRKLYKDMFTWGQADRLRLVVVLDEAHRLSKDVTLPKLMKEGRKFGVAVVVASQGLADFHADVLGNAGTKVVFRINHPDSKRVAGFVRAAQGVDLAAKIEQLGVGQAYVQTPDMRLGSAIKMLPPQANG